MLRALADPVALWRGLVILAVMVTDQRPVWSPDHGWAAGQAGGGPGCRLHACLRAAVTKPHKLGASNNRNALSHCSGCWKSQVQVSGAARLRLQGRRLPGRPFLSSQLPPYSASEAPWASSSVSVCVHVSLFLQEESSWMKRPPATRTTSSYLHLNYSCITLGQRTHID